MKYEYKELPYVYEVDKEVYSIGMKANAKLLDVVGMSNNPSAILFTKENGDVVFAIRPKYYSRIDESGNKEFGIEWGQGIYFGSSDVSCETLKRIYESYGYEYKLNRDVIGGQLRNATIDDDFYFISIVSKNGMNYSPELQKIKNDKYNTLDDLADALLDYGIFSQDSEIDYIKCISRSSFGFKIPLDKFQNLLREKLIERERKYSVDSEYSRAEIIFPNISFEDVVNKASEKNDKITSKDVWDACDSIIREFTQALTEEVKYSMESIVADANKKDNKINTINKLKG